MGTKNSPELLPRTLNLLLLKTIARGRMHRYGIAQHLKIVSEDVLQVGESSLYPALQRLLLNGWMKAEWGPPKKNRRARQLESEREEFCRMAIAIQRVLET